jgi:eukaryotic-like serine/threonine-protein kinase
VSTAVPAATGLPSGGEEARSFHQERLAFYTRTLLVILVGFYLAGNLAASFMLDRWLAANWVTKGANTAMLACFTFLAAVGLALRAPRLPRTLTLLDATVLLVTTTIFGSMALAPYVEDAPRDPVFRTAMAVMMTVIFRAVIVPSSARRTLLLSFLAVPIPLALSALVYVREGRGPAHIATHVVWTGSWHVAAAVLAGVTSRTIYGLRREVREAQQLGQYTLGEKIGEGGMGAVYHARHALLRRPTAIKLLTAARGGEAGAVRFEREAQLTSGLKHPNTVAIFDYGRTADGVFYYAMEYLDGLNLDDLVRADGAQPAARVVHVLRQVAGALVEAHGIGLIHRDIKPANVILLPEYGAALDVAKVVDFGLVKELADGGDLTQDQIAGTPMYLSPEAIREPDRVDARSDIYSLGLLGYYLVAGRPVFEGRNAVEICSHHLHTKPLPPAEKLGGPVPLKLGALLLDCLEKAPDARPASARELIARLAACDDVAAWTEDDARAWWQRHPPSASRSRAGTRDSASLATLSVVRRRS